MEHQKSDFKCCMQFCEHCGVLPKYRLTLNKDWTTWCICCSLAEGWITQELANQLYQAEKTIKEIHKDRQ